MALFKISHGQEANLPTERHEGWAYVTYQETSIPLGYTYGQGSMYVDVSATNRIKINAHADAATFDDMHQNIIQTYIKAITLQNDATNPKYLLTYGDGTVASAANTPLLPIASATNAGVITANKSTTQVLTGPKKLDGNGSLEISKSSGFKYSGIETGNSKKARPVWFAHSNTNGIPVINTAFTYDPASTDPWNGYGSEATGTAATAHGVLTVSRLQGIAYQAFLDANSNKITEYLKNVELKNHATQPYYTITRGTNISFDVNLPVANATNAGVITTGTQIFAGAKTFNDDVEIIGLFKYSGINAAPIKDSKQPIWFADIDALGTPIYDTNFTYISKCSDKWEEYSSTEAYPVLNVGRVNGLARYAVADHLKHNIADYYIHSIDENPTINDESLLYYYTLGNNVTSGPIVTIPEASTLTPGLMTRNTQYFQGSKMFIDESFGVTGSDGINFSEAEFGVTAEQLGVISIVGEDRSPLYLMTRNDAIPPIQTNCHGLVINFNADHVDGFNASNDIFTWDTSNKVSEQVLPTRSAICRSLNNLLQASQALYYKGTIDPTNSSTIPNSANIGDVYIFSKAGTFSSQKVEAGDMAICSFASSSTITWNIVQMNIDGAVRSNTSSTTDGEFVLFDGTSGKVIKNSGIYTTSLGGSTYIYGDNLYLGYTPKASKPIKVIKASEYQGGAVLTGTPTAPTAAEGTNTTQIATTAFVKTAINTAITGAKSDVANNFVAINGDTMTGPLTVPIIELNQPDEDQPDIIGIFAKAPNLSIAGDINSSLGPAFLNAPTILSHDINDSGYYTSYTFSPTYGIQILSDFTEDGNSAVIGYTNEAYGVTWAIDVDGFFNGWASRAVRADNATNATKLYVNNDTTSKLCVLGATSTGNQSVYRESNVYMQNDVLYGAAWNDYAEFRQGNTLEPGKCVVEAGDDTLTLATGRMIPGASIVSDTFGFSIGETEKCKTPIAVSGRVLAYPYESREEFKKNIGRPVCSGPNGTVSIMTDEEYREKGYCALGTISAVPDYEEWGTGNVKVNNRVWIHIK